VTDYRITSRRVDCLPVIDLLAPHLGDPGLIPGTPSWCQLDDTHPAKWQAICQSAAWWAIAEEGRQAAMAEASHAIAESTDWTAVSRSVRRRESGVYIPRRVA
jgi:hypothetical protein